MISALKLLNILKYLNCKVGRRKRDECNFYQKFQSFGKENGTRKVTQWGTTTVCFIVWGTYLGVWLS